MLQETAKKIVKKLNQAGFVAYFAGGCVRDRLLNRKVNDIDIATSATPEDVEKLFTKTHPLGKEFGVVLVIEDKEAFEVATFRGESDYDGRKPAKVFFTDAEEDAKRRDFTVNGLFLNPLNNEVLDFVKGQHDLKARVIRFIGNPDERVEEDYLRILRGIRFRNLLRFEYETATAEAIRKHAKNIQQISGERIRDELNRMFENENRAKAVRDLDEFGLLEVLLPELVELKKLPQPEEFHREGDTFTHVLASFAALPKKVSLAVAWATLLHDIGKAQTIRKDADRIRYPGHAEASAKIAGEILKRLRFDNATRAKIIWLVENHMMIGDLEKMRLAHRYKYFTHPWFGELMQVCLADSKGIFPQHLSLWRKVNKMWKEATASLLLPPPKDLLRGDEIVDELHIPKGNQVGRLKKILHDAQVEGLVKTREEAIRFLEKCLKR